MTSMVVDWWKAIGVDLSIHVKDSAVKAAMFTTIPRTYPEGMMVQSVRMATPTNIWSAQFAHWEAVTLVISLIRHIDQTYAALLAEPDYANQCKMIKDLAVYALEQAYKSRRPTPVYIQLWQPWLNNYEGIGFMSSWGEYQSISFSWVDQDLKEKMTGRR